MSTKKVKPAKVPIPKDLIPDPKAALELAKKIVKEKAELYERLRHV
jgi:hypothetical protein